MIQLVILITLLQAEPVDLLIEGGTVVTMDPEMRVLEQAAIAVRGDRIAAVLDAGEPRPEAREVVDARGHLVISGLVNSHGHVPMILRTSSSLPGAESEPPTTRRAI